MKILIFKSETTKAIYSWNGSEIVTIVGAKNRPVGKIMNGGSLTKELLNKAALSDRGQFKAGEALYTILQTIKLP